MTGFKDSGDPFGSPFGQPNEDPFGDPNSITGGADYQSSAAGSGSSSYVMGQVEQDTEHLKIGMDRVSIVNSPWPLWVAAVGYLAGCIQSGWAVVHLLSQSRFYLTDTVRTVMWSQVFLSLLFIAAIGIGVFAVLKAQAWGRILLTAISFFGIFLIVWGNMWITTLLLVASAVFLWLPRNTRWFGYRRKYQN